MQKELQRRGRWRNGIEFERDDDFMGWRGGWREESAGKERVRKDWNMVSLQNPLNVIEQTCGENMALQTHSVWWRVAFLSVALMVLQYTKLSEPWMYFYSLLPVGGSRNRAKKMQVKQTAVGRVISSII